MEARELARYLWEEVHDRYPFIPTPKLEKWESDIDKIHRIDGFDWPVIQYVLGWSQQDPFWRQQIRSAQNLRKHFIGMMVRIKETEGSKTKIWTV